MSLNIISQEPKTPLNKHYVAPTIVYQGQISSRAGSPTDPIVPGEERDVDPVDLFDDSRVE